MSDWQINSALLAAHNLALAVGQIAKSLAIIAVALFVYPWLGGFGSQHKERKP